MSPNPAGVTKRKYQDRGSLSMVPPKPVRPTKRTHEENQERAYISASRRHDRSLEARMESAHRASAVHKKRTGRALHITERTVIDEEIYEEEEDDHIVRQHHRLHSQIPPTTPIPQNPRFREFMATQYEVREAFMRQQFPNGRPALPQGDQTIPATPQSAPTLPLQGTDQTQMYHFENPVRQAHVAHSPNMIRDLSQPMLPVYSQGWHGIDQSQPQMYPFQGTVARPQGNPSQGINTTPHPQYFSGTLQQSTYDFQGPMLHTQTPQPLGTTAQTYPAPRQGMDQPQMYPFQGLHAQGSSWVPLDNDITQTPLSFALPPEMQQVVSANQDWQSGQSDPMWQALMQGSDNIPLPSDSGPADDFVKSVDEIDWSSFLDNEVSNFG